MSTALDIDMYQASMLRGYFENGMAENQGAMELFARKMPHCRDFFVVAGIGRIVNYLANLKFTEEDIRILRSIPALQIPEGSDGDAFCNYLASIDFAKQLKLYSIPEGSVAFPNQPILRVEGPIGLCQFVEKRLLSVINHDVRIASKAARVVLAAKGRPVFEFGGRRAHEECSPDTARAAYIAGFAGSSNVQAFAEYGVPAIGTMGHVWIMSHETEEKAFQNWSKVFNNSVYLVDTYNTHDGIDNAVKYAYDNISGIRLDSGDLYQLSVSAKRVMQKSSGSANAKVVASNDLDEYSITDLLEHGASIDSFGVGTQLVSTPDSASLGFVYKLVSTAYEPGLDAKQHPICKIAELGKGTWPGKKQICRNFVEYGNETIFTNDIVALADEERPSALATPLLVEQPIVVEDQHAIVVTARERFKSTMESLPPYMKAIPKKPLKAPKDSNTELRKAEYPVGFSDKLSQLRQEIQTARGRHH